MGVGLYQNDIPYRSTQVFDTGRGMFQMRIILI